MKTSVDNYTIFSRLVLDPQTDLTSNHFKKYYILSAREGWSKCKYCRLHKVRKKVIYGAGALAPRILIIGEAPGPQENKKGIPFIGPAGKLLRKVLAAPSVDLIKYCFITNVIACYPSDDGVRFRRPREDEIKACSPRVDMFHEVTKPKIVVLLGNVALSMIEKTGITRERGWHTHWRFYDSYIYATVHPSYIIRQGGMAKRKLVREYVKDWRRIRKAMEKLYG